MDAQSADLSSITLPARHSIRALYASLLCMYSLEEITDVESRYRDGAPSLGQALEMLLARWNVGARDEETVLRLLFLLWYNVVEPIDLTGLPSETDSSLFRKVFEEA